MKKLEKFTFEKEDGTTVEANVLGCFTIKELDKTYLIYTVDDSTTEASIIVQNGEVLELKNIDDDDKYAVEKLISEMIGKDVQ